MAKFQIFKGSNGQHYFHLKATGNNEIILQSEGYTSKTGCQSGIDSVKTNAPNDSRYTRLIATNGQYYFTLKSFNGEIIGRSETYTTTWARDRGIDLVKTQAPTALVEDNA